MKQLTLVSNDFERFRKPTRREKFLAEMNTVVPWADLVALIEPYYPKASSAGGRPPVGLERMLRMYLLANWFNLSDEACEDALYDMPAFRDFCGIDLGRERAPDATTLLRLNVRIDFAFARPDMLRSRALIRGSASSTPPTKTSASRTFAETGKGFIIQRHIGFVP